MSTNNVENIIESATHLLCLNNLSCWWPLCYHIDLHFGLQPDGIVCATSWLLSLAFEEHVSIFIYLSQFFLWSPVGLQYCP